MSNCTKFIAWEVEGKTILTNQGSASVRYIRNIPEAEFDAHLEMVLAQYLASKAAYAITGDTGRETQMANLFNEKLNEARITDSQERTHRTLKTSQLSDVR